MSAAAAKIQAPGWSSARFIWLARATRSSTISDAGKVLASCLAVDAVDRATGETFCRWATLGRMIGKAERTVRRLAAELEVAGFLGIERAPGRAGHVVRLRMPPVPARDRTREDPTNLVELADARQDTAEATGPEAAGTSASSDRGSVSPSRRGRARPPASPVDNRPAAADSEAQPRPVVAEGPASSGRPPLYSRIPVSSSQRGRARPPAGTAEKPIQPPPSTLSAEERQRIVCVLLADGIWAGPVGQAVTAERIEALVEEGRVTAERGAELLAEHGPKAAVEAEPEPRAGPWANLKTWRSAKAGMPAGLARAACDAARGAP